ncbi:MAG: aspartate carbamoyltransferase catalytic subunit [Firmicutes bacterium]|nr:aspartate carbamoyltransferase catalytic subunit [Bacillota bacterium]
MKNKDLLGLKDLSAAEITSILDAAIPFKTLLEKGDKKTNHLSGKSIVSLFYENSTRTRVSFEAAAKFMGGAFMSIQAATSSIQKGETLVDTGQNLDAMKTDVIILRHPTAGAPHLLAGNVKASVINAGDGMNEHPTQALLDIFTMREKLGNIKGKKVTIVGDIAFSRVARSNIWGLSKLGANVTICAPKSLLPKGIEKFPCDTTTDIEFALKNADIIMGLRIQTERQQGAPFPSIAEYAVHFGVSESRLKIASKNVIIMHPGPVNRGVEMTSSVIDSANSVILQQVTNGVAIRMALLDILANCKEGKK